MLAYILAVLVGTSSVGLYLWAFLFPEIHRKQDFIWSGVGLFYALFLWLYARQVTGGILVGQTTSVALLGWFGWETFKLRRQLVPIDRSSNTEPNVTNRQQPSDSRRATPEVIKQIQKTPTPLAATSRQPQSVPAATPERPSSGQTPVASSIPLERVKVPPVTSDRSTPIASKVAPPAPPPTPVNSSPPKVTLPQSIDSIPVTKIAPPATDGSVPEDEAWIKLEVKPAPAPSKPLGSPAQPPAAVNIEPTKSLAVEPEIVTKNIPIDPTQTTTGSESQK
ncbi:MULTISPECIES: Ycf66 family protein [unclassified Chamaesiphon]|uniref:Ycf66 family protein n=1 Tax=unclassified Chamaesiphon TaxID=2620921 RepID=UPI00286CAD44|nr:MULTISPECIES: Ycf66 family protein [unclassified Chamaesiphon]